MSIHSRPVRAPKIPTQVAPNAITTPLVRPEPKPAPPPVETRSSEADQRAEPSRVAVPHAEPAASGTSLPWYRSEPWIALALGAFAPLLGAVIAPDMAQYPLIGLSGVLLVASIVMLLRQGVFRGHPGSVTHRE
jgi:hypothetical protein